MDTPSIKERAWHYRRGHLSEADLCWYIIFQSGDFVYVSEVVISLVDI